MRIEAFRQPGGPAAHGSLCAGNGIPLVLNAQSIARIISGRCAGNGSVHLSVGQEEEEEEETVHASSLLLRKQLLTTTLPPGTENQKKLQQKSSVNNCARSAVSSKRAQDVKYRAGNSATSPPPRQKQMNYPHVKTSATQVHFFFGLTAGTAWKKRARWQRDR